MLKVIWKAEFKDEGSISEGFLKRTNSLLSVGVFWWFVYLFFFLELQRKDIMVCYVLFYQVFSIVHILDYRVTIFIKLLQDTVEVKKGDLLFR